MGNIKSLWQRVEHFISGGDENMDNSIKFGQHVGGEKLKALYGEIGALWEAEADGILEKAAQAYATGGVYDKAIGLFEKLGKRGKVKELQLEEKAIGLAMDGKQDAAMELFDVYADDGKPEKALEKVNELFGRQAEANYVKHLEDKSKMKSQAQPYYLNARGYH